MLMASNLEDLYGSRFHLEIRLAQVGPAALAEAKIDLHREEAFTSGHKAYGPQ